MDLMTLQPEAPPPLGELRYGFRMAGLQLVPAARVLTEMVAEARIFPIPKASVALAGVTNLRGTIVPLLDRRVVHRGGISIRPFQHRALVFDHDDQRIGLLLDAAPELLSLRIAPAGAIRPGGVFSAFLGQAWVEIDRPDQTWWEFDHRAAFKALVRSTSSVRTEPAKAAISELLEVIP